MGEVPLYDTGAVLHCSLEDFVSVNSENNWREV